MSRRRRRGLLAALAICSHRSVRYFRSARNSSSSRSSPAVRTMKPPVPGEMRSRMRLEPRPFALVLDAPRHADVIDRRHVDEKAPRQGDVAGDARPLAGDRVFRHLHDDLLPLAQQIAIDAPRRAAADLLDDISSERLVVELLEILDDVGDVEKRVALQPEVDEGRLHAGKDLRDAPFVDVADDGAMARPLDPKLDDLPVLEDGDSGLMRIALDEHLETHGEGDCSGSRTPHPRPLSRPLPPSLTGRGENSKKTKALELTSPSSPGAEGGRDGRRGPG